MKLAEAEQLLKLVKQDGPLTEYWSCWTDEGVLLEAWPLGFARGSRALLELNVRPHMQYSALFTGGQVRRIHSSGHGVFGSGLWEQEFYVYMNELKEQVRAALKDLQFAPFAPRTKHIHDWRPQREDFRNISMRSKTWEWDREGLHKEQKSALAWTFIKDNTCDMHKFWRDLNLYKKGFVNLLEKFTQGEIKCRITSPMVKGKSTSTPSSTTPDKPKTKPNGTNGPSPSSSWNPPG